jgi:5'-3' exonuclease
VSDRVWRSASWDQRADGCVRLWEPGYRERYYRNKFGVELSDREFVDQ